MGRNDTILCAVSAIGGIGGTGMVTRRWSVGSGYCAVMNHCDEVKVWVR